MESENSMQEASPPAMVPKRSHGKRLKENLVRVQTLSSGQKHVTIPAPLARAANIERGDVVEWRICKSTGRLELNVLKNYVAKQEVKEPEQETNEVSNDASSPVHSGEHGQASV